MVRELQPGIIVNKRLDLSIEAPDIHVLEQVQPSEWFNGFISMKNR